LLTQTSCIAATFQQIAHDRLGALGSLTVATTAHAIDHNSNWPFMTLSWFQQRALTTRSLSGALMVTFNPYVTADKKAAWDNYSFNSSDTYWHAQGLAYERQLHYENYKLKFVRTITCLTVVAFYSRFLTFLSSSRCLLQDPAKVTQRVTPDPNLILDGLANHIWTLDANGDSIIDPSKGPFIPSWETSPVFIRTQVNRNLLTDPNAAKPSNTSFSTASVVFGGFEFAPNDLGTGTEPPETKLYTTLLSISKKRIFPYTTSPLTRIYLPVFDSFVEATKKPVALMSALIRWESYFVNVLPSQIRGVNMVLNNQCGAVYTFKITGTEPDPVGLGDLHDTKFEHMARQASFADVASVDDGSPTGIKLNHDVCTYEMTAYPNQLMLDDFRTSLPALITFAVALVFIFTFSMFIIYDRLVERRQNLVLQRAEQTTAIVQSLFPKSVADKLMMHSTDNDILASKNQKLNKFLGGDEQGKSCIADLFPECTVLFSDISGKKGVVVSFSICENQH
jgi:hypothetical protein